MESLIAYFATRQFLARIITIMVMLAGAASLYTLKLQEYPDIAFDSADIETFYPGSTAQDVELNITNPIEKELRSVEGIKYFSSQSTDGVSAIEVEFLPGEDAARILRDIQQAVDRVEGLPEDITNPPVVTQMQTSSLDILRFGVGLSNPEDDEAQLQNYAYQLEKSLNNVSGVGKVTMFGYNEREFWVQIDPEKASRYQVTFDDLSQAVELHNLSQSGGVVESWSREQKIVTMTQVQTAQDISDIVVKSLGNGTLVKVGDVATVVDTFAKATQKGTVNGSDAIIFSVTNSSNADIIATVENVKALLEKEQTRLNGQFQFEISENIADDMNDKFSIVATNGGIGLVLVLLCLLYTSPSPRDED